jgi:alpha-beta hydrolase superfamily lysophospholipase
MITRKMLTVVAGALAGALAAGEYLQYYRPGPLPEKTELEGYFDDLFEMMGLAGLRRQIDDGSVYSDGLRLHLDIFRAEGSNKTVVFVPGTSVYSLFYAEYMHKLRMLGFNVVGFDPRGHGRSEGKRGSYTVETLLRDSEAVVSWAMNTFGGSVAMSGSSQGGITTFYAACRDHRLSAVVCHNIAVLGQPEAFSISRWPMFSATAAKVLPLQAMLTPELRIPISTYLDLSAEPTRFGRHALQFVKEDPLAVLAIATRAMASLSWTPPPKPIEEIDIPVMVIQGELDEMFTEYYVRRIYDRLTCEKEFLVVNGATHLVLTNDVDAIIGEVAAFLDTHM